MSQTTTHDSFALARFFLESQSLSHAAKHRSQANTTGSKKAFELVDIGCGDGTVGLEIATRYPELFYTFIDIDPEALKRAKSRATESALRFRVVQHDIRDTSLLVPENTHGVELPFTERRYFICNPPYFETGTGRPSPDPRRNEIRHGEMRAFIKFAASQMRPKEGLWICFPPSRLFDVLNFANDFGLHAKSAQALHPTLQQEARLLLLELRKAKPGSLRWLAPACDR